MDWERSDEEEPEYEEDEEEEIKKQTPTTKPTGFKNSLLADRYHQ